MEKVVRARISSELKDAFDQVCKQNAVNPSALIRLWIEKYVCENQEETEINGESN